MQTVKTLIIISFFGLAFTNCKTTGAGAGATSELQSNDNASKHCDRKLD